MHVGRLLTSLKSLSITKWTRNVIRSSLKRWLILIILKFEYKRILRSTQFPWYLAEASGLPLFRLFTCKIFLLYPRAKLQPCFPPQLASVSPDPTKQIIFPNTNISCFSTEWNTYFICRIVENSLNHYSWLFWNNFLLLVIYYMLFTAFSYFIFHY